MKKLRNLNGVMDADTISKNGTYSKSLMSRVYKKGFLSITVACIVVLFCASVSFKSNEISSDNTNQLIGVWKHVSSTMMGADMMEIKKVFTKNCFIMLYIVNDEIVASKGGTYTFDGETCTENIEYATQNQRTTIGKKATVKVRFEEKKIYTTGAFEGIALNEVWERVE